MDDIMETFDGRYKTQKTPESNWLPVPNEQIPEPRPGKCVDDSRTIPLKSMAFIKSHILMEQAAPTAHKRPMLTRVNLKHRFTAITVDPQIRALDQNAYDVLFIGTDDGMIIKMINDLNSTSIVITETQALPHGMQVKELTVSQATQSLIVVANGHIVSIPLHHCKNLRSCRDCYNLQDPYCVWDVDNHECTAITFNNRKHIFENPVNYLQNLQANQRDGVDVCKKYGDSGNWIDPPSIVAPPPANRGTVAAVGRSAHTASSSYDNEITVTSIDGVELTNKIILTQQNPILSGVGAGGVVNGGVVNGAGSGLNHIHLVDPLVKESQLGGGDVTELASMSVGKLSIIIIMCVLFLAGLGSGFFISKLKVRFSPCYSEHHRSQLNA